MIRFPQCLMALVLLAGCAVDMPPPYQGRDYGALPPERLNVASILIDNEYVAPAAAPNVDHLFQPGLVDMLSSALHTHYPRLMTQHDHGVEIRFVIKDASVVETDYPKPEYLLDRMTHEDPEYRFDGHLLVEAYATGGYSRRTAFASADVTRSLELPRCSVEARTRQVHGMIEQMVDEAMDQLQSQIDGNFGSLLYGDGSNDQTVTPHPSGRWDKVMNWK